MSQDSAFDDASIPVLTEVVREMPAPAAQAAPAAPVPAATPGDAVPEPVAEPERDAAHQHVAAEQPGEPDWAALELRLCEQIATELQGPIDALLQQRLREGMADVLQHVLAGLSEEIRHSLAPAIEQIVREAVAQERGQLKPQRH
jgi:hypothetical protein